MSKKWLVPSIGFILILPLISFYYLNEISPKITNKPRRILRNVNELRSYMHPADSPQYQQHMSSQMQRQFDELSLRRRRLGGDPCPGCVDPTVCAPFCQASCITAECGGTPPPTEAPTPPPSMPPTPDRSTLINIDDTGNTPYIFVDFGEHHFSYDTTNYFCQNEIGGGSTLATIDKTDTRNTQQQQINIMTGLAKAQAFIGHSCWFGLKYFNKTKSFYWQNDQGTQTAANKLNTETDAQNWMDNAPDGNINICGDCDLCAVMVFVSDEAPHNTLNYKWDVTFCDHSLQYATHCALCNNPNYVPNPTNSPTNMPSSTPTKKPTISPTKKPTDQPSKTPTKKPTSQPSKKPTGQPTKKPTVPPTKKPTSQPTNAPTKKPTTQPSKKPTGSPTKKPTGPPTKKPTAPPTKKPTIPPTKKPTEQPTKKPTNAPTQKPTSVPSEIPTSTPTQKPTSVPTKTPTDSPTKKPTSSPTKIPTDIPTQTPTNNPTQKPTDVPTQTPTSIPTQKPTSQPSQNPTSTPSQNPTDNPSQKPTSTPTSKPTSNPTQTPSDNPTKNPTTPAPVHPYTQSCGCGHSGDYNDVPVEAEILVDHDSTVIFDCSQSAFIVGHISATDDSGFIDDIDGDVLTLFDQRANKLILFEFTAEAPTISTYTFNVTCPTQSPTQKPTSVPSKKPTTDPTQKPTSSPSKNPTENPTKYPTKKPTSQPSKNPTNNPTQNPTSPPSKNPTSNPTQNPTSPPSKKPTENPTEQPSEVPTKKPTGNPTEQPSKNPTETPTLKPSVSPTEIPTNAPTMKPSDNPTDVPSDNPTMKPTSSPSDNPTDVPSDNPSYSPSNYPSAPPSKYPTNNPITKSPSKYPTVRPSDSPTEKPSDAPSDNPTVTPSDQPSVSPSDIPTVSPTDVTYAPSKLPSVSPSDIPTRTPTGDDDACGDDRKEWTVRFPCAGQPRFQLVSTCSDGYAIELSLDKVFEVDIDKRGVGNSINKFGKSKQFGKDLDFNWDGGNFGNSVGLYTVDGEEREVIKNKFSAKLSKRVRKRKGGRKNKLDSWLNITVFYFIDERGGTFDLRNTGDQSKYITPEPFTLKYIIDSENWPFKRKSDLLAMQFTASVVQAEYGFIQVLQCLYDGWINNNYDNAGRGYGGAYGPWGDGGGYDGSGQKGKGKGKSKGRRVLLHSKWKRNPLPRSGCSGKKSKDKDCDGWGEYTDSTLTTYNTDVDNFDFAFGIDFRIESVLISLIDNADVHIESVFVDPTWDSVTMIHYFPKFVKLEFDGASLFYKPTFDYWASQEKAEKRDSANSNNKDHKAFGGEDIQNQPKFKTQDENNENGMFTKLWNEMSWLNWIIVFGGALLLTVCICCSCFWICYKIKQNTHENNSFVKLE